MSSIRTHIEVRRIDWRNHRNCQAPVEISRDALGVGCGLFICGHASSWRVSPQAGGATANTRTACEEPGHLGLVIEGLVSSDGGIERYHEHH